MSYFLPYKMKPSHFRILCSLAEVDLKRFQSVFKAFSEAIGKSMGGMIKGYDTCYLSNFTCILQYAGLKSKMELV